MSKNGKWPEDPQLRVQGILKYGEKADIIVFTIPLALFELVCIVTIPPEGETIAPVYVKFKIKKPWLENGQDTRPGPEVHRRQYMERSSGPEVHRRTPVPPSSNDNLPED